MERVGTVRFTPRQYSSPLVVVYYVHEGSVYTQIEGHPNTPGPLWIAHVATWAPPLNLVCDPALSACGMPLDGDQ